MKIHFAKVDNVWLTRVVATLYSSAEDKNFKLVLAYYAMMFAAMYTMPDNKFVVNLYSWGGCAIKTLILVVKCGTSNQKYCEHFPSCNHSNIQPQ